jgi:hypothetical protein
MKSSAMAWQTSAQALDGAGPKRVPHYTGSNASISAWNIASPQVV